MMPHIKIAGLALTFYLAICSSNMCSAWDELSLVEEAFRQTDSSVRSGRGAGRLKRIRADGVVVSECQFNVEFDGPKYRLVITNQVAANLKLRYDKISVVCDGQALLATRYSPAIRNGCETTIRDVKQISEATDGFPWAPNRLHAAAIDPTRVFTKFKVAAKKDERGDIIGEYDLTPGYRIRFTSSAAAGYHVTNIVGLKASGEDTGIFWNIDWARYGSEWYIRSLYHNTGAGTVNLTLESLELNITHAKDLFSLEGLQPCDGSRIIDQRQKHEPIIYRFDASIPKKEATLESMSQSLKALKSSTPVPKQSTTIAFTEGRYRLWISGNVVLVAVLVIVVIYFRSRKS